MRDGRLASLAAAAAARQSAPTYARCFEAIFVGLMRGFRFQYREHSACSLPRVIVYRAKRWCRWLYGESRVDCSRFPSHGTSLTYPELVTRATASLSTCFFTLNAAGKLNTRSSIDDRPARCQCMRDCLGGNLHLYRIFSRIPAVSNRA